MNWLDKLERKYGRFAIPNIMIYVTTAMLVVYGFEVLLRAFNVSYYIALIPSLVLRGQVWRLITFIFMPPNASVLTILLALYFYYVMGTTLERCWGTFRFNVYYLCGILGAIIAAFISGFGTNTYLNLSLFLAFAAIFPDQEVLLFYIIPIKVKYLALLDWVYFGFTILFGSFYSRMAGIFSLINFFIFFGPDFWNRIRTTMRYRKVQKNFRQNNNDLWR